MSYNDRNGVMLDRPDALTRALHSLPPETAHNFGIKGLRYLGPYLPRVSVPEEFKFETTCLGLKFANPVCLAAGFDKNAECINGLSRIGFGGIEAGSITPEAQSGNPKPRLFRLSEQRALINRMGFNSHGIAAACTNLKKRNFSSVLGVNFGLNKGIADYERQFLYLTRALTQYADYITINLSSPNAEGLRDLLDPKHLRPILAAVYDGFAEIGKARPIVLKLSPDMDIGKERELLAEICKSNIAGIIVSNTSIERDMLPTRATYRDEIGGLSGRPIADKARLFLDRVVDVVRSDIDIIASGGIDTGKDIYDRLRAGANLVQIYTSFVYRGRLTVPELLLQLRQCMDENGHRSLSEVCYRSRY